MQTFNTPKSVKSAQQHQNSCTADISKKITVSETVGLTIQFQSILTFIVVITVTASVISVIKLQIIHFEFNDSNNSH